MREVGNGDRNHLGRRIACDAFAGSCRLDDASFRLVPVIETINADIVFRAYFRESGLNDNGVGVNLRIGNHHALTDIGGEKFGPGFDLLDSSLVIAGDDLITDPERLAGHNQNTRQQGL